MRFSGAPVFLPVQREKGWRAEQHGPTYQCPAGGTAWGRPCSEGPRTAPAASTRRAQHPAGTRRALVHSSQHRGGSGAPRLPQAPHPQGFRLPPPAKHPLQPLPVLQRVPVVSGTLGEKEPQPPHSTYGARVLPASCCRWAQADLPRRHRLVPRRGQHYPCSRGLCPPCLRWARSPRRGPRCVPNMGSTGLLQSKPALCDKGFINLPPVTPQHHGGG